MKHRPVNVHLGCSRGVRAAAVVAALYLLGAEAVVAQVPPGSANSDATAEAAALGLATNGVGIANNLVRPVLAPNQSVAVDYRPVFSPTFEFQSSRIPPPPTGLPVATQAPDLFRQLTGTLPSQARGVNLGLRYLQDCSPTLSDSEPREMFKKGASGNTEITFLPHPDYVATLQAREEETSPDTRIVNIDFPQEARRHRCLGILSVAAREKRTDEVHFFTLANDAMRFAKANMRGESNVSLLCAANAISLNSGVHDSGLGAALSPGISDASSGGGTLYTLLGGLGIRKGRTFPDVQLGLSCIVAGAEGDTVINLARLNGVSVAQELARVQSGSEGAPNVNGDVEAGNGNGNGPSVEETVGRRNRVLD